METKTLAYLYNCLLHEDAAKNSKKVTKKKEQQLSALYRAQLQNTRQRLSLKDSYLNGAKAARTFTKQSSPTCRMSHMVLTQPSPSL